MQKAMFVFDTSVDPSALSAFCLEAGVDSIVLHPGFFDNDSFAATLRRHGLKIWLNLPVFFDEQYVSQHPEAYSITSKGNRAVHSWLHMVCPSQETFLDLKCRTLSNLLRRISPDCISYDFIRFYVFWEEVELGNPPDHIEHGCYCPECRRRFARFAGEDIAIQDGVIDKGQRAALGLWKMNVVEDTVGRLNAIVEDAAKGTPTYIKTVPWRSSELENALHWITGQDPVALSTMSDGIIPMAFTQILGKTPRWKKELLDHLQAETGRDVMSYVQIEPLIRPTTIDNQQLEDEIKAAIAENRPGLIYFHYEQLAGKPEKQETLKKFRAK